MKTVNEIRSSFFDYFIKHNHEAVASSSLVPDNDATLMFTNAGMVQFKNVFTGLEQRNYNKAVTVQKCVRAGGKHNDLDNVGYTARHHTFFEMMGNFSFGDYFKEEAIYYAWNFLTKILCLPAEKLLVTIFHTDLEARALWKKIAGLTDNKIIAISTNDNFWSMGDTGPCGPCSEIFYDHGESIAGGPPGSSEEDGDRFIEIWNLVFMQYDQMLDGKKMALPKPSIDTGAGIERVAAVLQQVPDNYQIDLFKHLIDAIEDVTKIKAIGDKLVSHKVIADHLRSMSFLIADGVIPSNEKRGYVLRRIMRRAMRHAHLLEAKEPIIWRLVPALIAQMGVAYPELLHAKNFIEEVIKDEEERFGETLYRGMEILNTALTSSLVGKKFSGEVAFKLYDTYGFPLDLTQDILKARNLEVDIEVFDKYMENQKLLSKANWAGSGDKAIEGIWFSLQQKLTPTEFLGYEEDTTEATLQAIIKDALLCDGAQAGEECYLVFDKTVFYAESGGQVSDKGCINSAKANIEVLDVQKQLGKLFVHKVKILGGAIAKGDKLILSIDRARRNKIAANHSATHLLHKALQMVLGATVQQKGSLVTSEYLRFDFSYNKALTIAEITKVEHLVNKIIQENTAILIKEMPLKEAKTHGVMALFSEKYGDIVRVVAVGAQGQDYWSKELCGGTHSKTTLDIGCFKIISQRSVAAGIRRIEAVTADIAELYEQKHRLNIERFLDYMPAIVFENIAKNLQQDNSIVIEQDDIITKGDVTIVTKILSDMLAKDLKSFAEKLRAEYSKSIVILFSNVQDGKVAIVIAISLDLLPKYNAIDLVRLTAPILGGTGGGGRADMAQAGGNDASQIPSVLKALLNIV